MVMPYFIVVFASLMHLHLMHYTIMLLAHIWLIYPLGHVYVEPELEVQAEQAQAEDFTNLDLDQGKPGAFNQCSLYFIFESCSMFYFDCALSL
jgi:hypothetical protein